MKWKLVGSSVIGTSHLQSSKECEDSVSMQIITNNGGNETLICCVSDGAGSAKFGGYAAKFVTNELVKLLTEQVREERQFSEEALLILLEHVYDCLSEESAACQQPLNEFSCTCLGCVVTDTTSLFFQIGDGAIIREDNCGNYTIVFWPENGEYLNTTRFLIDDVNFSSLQLKIIEEPVNEIAMITDGLQMLALNYETSGAYAPFFQNLFKVLRMANQPEHLVVVQNKLKGYLESDVINGRTDDDKTLFLATRKTHEQPNI